VAKLRFYLALWVSKLVAHMINIVDKSRGTNLPGTVALKIDPQFIKHIRGIDPEKTVFITGTNGKSSTTKHLHHILTKSGYRVVSNLGGANMITGVAVPLLRSASLTGRIKCDFAVMETDERYVSRIRRQLPAKYLAITNIQKDQVQRNGEPGFIYERLRKAVEPDMTLFLNRDEPNTLSLHTACAERIIRYGITPHERSFEKEADFFSVTMPCPVCHSGIVFHKQNLENIGSYRCPVCGFGNDAQSEYLTSQVSFENREIVINGTTYPFRCSRPEFLYSYTLAIAIALELGIPEAAIAAALETCDRNIGNGEPHAVGDKQVCLYRIKQENSETLQFALSAIGTDPKPKTVILGLDEYIDFYPPYVNGCYFFDCSFAKLRESGVEQCICTSPALGHLGAMRLLYDGFDPAIVTVVPDSLEPTLSKALHDDTTENIYLIEEIPFWKR